MVLHYQFDYDGYLIDYDFYPFDKDIAKCLQQYKEEELTAEERKILIEDNISDDEIVDEDDNFADYASDWFYSEAQDEFYDDSDVRDEYEDLCARDRDIYSYNGVSRSWFG